jgi:Flp pilus assembly protein TadG
MMRRRSLASDPSGATLPEFGLLAIPLCMLLTGVLDLGYQSYIRSVLQGALNDVARAASIESPNIGSGQGTLESRISAEIRSRMESLVRGATYSVNISNYYRFAGVGQPERLVNDRNSNGRYDALDCWEDTKANGTYDTDSGTTGVGGADDVVFYDVTMTTPRIVPTASLFGASPNVSVSVRAAVRSQPYANQRQPAIRC